jgi:protein-S-isoprenylcysteine O-methyltransferase Ste14
LANEDVVRAGRLFVALLLLAAGSLLALAGTFHLGANLAVLPRPKENGVLVQNGAYRLVRHPIYSGLILGAVGWALWRNGPLTLLFALVLAVVLDIKSRREEQWLAEKFPEYAAYQRRVRKLIPLLY